MSKNSFEAYFGVEACWACVSTIWHSVEAINGDHIIKKSDLPLKTFQWPISFIFLCGEIYMQSSSVCVCKPKYIPSAESDSTVEWSGTFSWRSHVFAELQ